MGKRHIIEAIVRIWETTTTESKIKLIVSSIMIIAAAGVVGYKIGTFDMSHRLTVLESKYERQLTELESKGVKYISEFSTNDWLNIEGQGSQLRIPFSDHKVDNPIVTVQQKEENGNWQDIGVIFNVDEFNNVIISVIYGFDGRVILK